MHGMKSLKKSKKQNIPIHKSILDGLNIVLLYIYIGKIKGFCKNHYNAYVLTLSPKYAKSAVCDAMEKINIIGQTEPIVNWTN